MLKYLNADYYLSLLRGDLFKKSFIMIGSSALNSFSRFFLVILLARYLSPESYGVWVSITSVAAIMIFGDFGITNALRNKLSIFIASGDQTNDLQRQYFYTSFYFFLGFAVLLSIGFLVLAPYIPIGNLYNTSNLVLKSQGVEIFVFIQIMFLLGIPFGMASGLYYTYNESNYVALLNIINSFFSIIVVVVFSVFLSVDIVTLAKYYFSVNLCIACSGLFFFLYRRGWLNKFSIDTKLIPSRLRELLQTGFFFVGIQLSTAYTLNMPTVFLGATQDLKVAATFNIAQKLYFFVITVYQSVFNPIWSKLSSMASLGNWLEFKRLYNRIVVITFVILFLATIFLTLFSDIVFKIAVGNQYQVSKQIVFYLGISFVFYGVFEAASLLQNALGVIKRRFFAQMVLVVLINTMLNLGLNQFGIVSVPFILSVVWFSLFLLIYLEGYHFLKNK